MKNFRNLFLIAGVLGAMTLTGCLHIIEEVTFNKNGSGVYKMTLDMSEVKGMMEMMKGMQKDSLAKDSTGAAAIPDNSMSQMGEQLSSVASAIKGVDGVSNIVELNDTAGFQFGYSFNFANINALNRALKIIGKDKFESKTDEVYKLDGKEFERLPAGNIGAEMKKALAENAGEEAEQNMDMMKMFFGEMSYKQIYHFPDRTIKKNNNDLGELSDDKHTLTINLKPFDEEQEKKKATVAAKLKLK